MMLYFNFHKATFHTRVFQACNCEIHFKMPNESITNRIPESSHQAQAEVTGSRENCEPRWHLALCASLKEA